MERSAIRGYISVTPDGVQVYEPHLGLHGFYPAKVRLSPQRAVDPQVDQRDPWFAGLGLSEATVADDPAIDFGRVFLASGPEARIALRVEPGVPVPGIDLQDRLEASAAPIDAALHERHGSPSNADCSIGIN